MTDEAEDKSTKDLKPKKVRKVNPVLPLNARKQNLIKELISGPDKKTGIPGHVVEDYTRHKVRAFSFLGYDQAQIAKLTGLSVNILQRHYRHELDIASADMLSEVASNLYNIARSDRKEAVPAAIFILKTRAHWRERDRVEVTGIDGKPIQVQSNQTFDSRKLTAEQREHLRDIMKAALTANLQSNAEDAELVDDDVEE